MPWWGAPLLTSIAWVALTVAFSIAAAVQTLAHGLPMSEAATRIGADPLNLGAIQAAAFGAAIFAGLVLYQRGVRTRDALYLRPVSLPAVALAIVGGFALQFPLAEIGNLAQEVWPVPVEEQIRRYRLVAPEGPLDAVVTILSIVVVAAASEELLFRGLMLPALEKRYGAGVAIGVTSALFGLVHGDPVAIAYATVAGVILGALALRTGSTVVPLVVHASINAVPIMLPERVVGIRGFNTVGEDVYHLPLPLLAGAAVVAAAALFGAVRLKEPRA